MKRCFILSFLCIVLTLLLVRLRPPVSPEGAEPPPPEPSAPPEADAAETVRLLCRGKVETMSLEEYLPGVVAAEMPASFASDALRAQAVAARTYTLYRKRGVRVRHPEADVCADPGCCQAWLSPEERLERWGEAAGIWSAAVEEAVRATDGVILTWNGEPILACFHASSAGATESSAAIWGEALPYLVSVTSPETAADVPGFVTTAELTAAELCAGVEALAPEADLSTPPERWLGGRVTDAGGRVSVQYIGGAAVPGERLRERFSLRSTAFTLVWNGDRFLFTVTGNGHGVGMSQYGAERMARDGSDWREILGHYYPGAALTAQT